MRVLLTGGAGFVGQATARMLEQRGHGVAIVDRNPRPGSVDPGVQYVQGDLEDHATVARAVRSGADVIVHLAAMTSVLESVSKPAEVVRANVGVTADLLEAARLGGTEAVVLASTNAVVGSGATGRIDESSPLAPMTAYGATKAAAEMLMSAYGASYGMSTCALRFTNIYGPGMAGKDSVVARLMRAARRATGIEIYGDGEQVRDYLYVEDAARAVCLAVEGGWSGPVVIGSGAPVSMNRLHELACAATGTSIPATRVPGRRGEMRRVEVDVTRARGLGFRARTGVGEGLEETWRYFRLLEVGRVDRGH